MVVSNEVLKQFARDTDKIKLPQAFIVLCIIFDVNSDDEDDLVINIGKIYAFIYRQYNCIILLISLSQPVPLADIEQVTLVKVQKDDQISSTVTLYLQNTVQKVN